MKGPRCALFVGALTLLSAAGCHILHDLQPHRLQRMNRNPDMGSGALYSVPDPIEQPTNVDEAPDPRRTDRL